MAGRYSKHTVVALARSSSRAAAATGQQASKHRIRSNGSTSSQKRKYLVDQSCFQAAWHTALAAATYQQSPTHQASVEYDSHSQLVSLKIAE
jgi:hypothetical protein